MQQAHIQAAVFESLVNLKDVKLNFALTHFPRGLRVLLI